MTVAINEALLGSMLICGGGDSNSNSGKCSDLTAGTESDKDGITLIHQVMPTEFAAPRLINILSPDAGNVSPALKQIVIVYMGSKPILTRGALVMAR